ncbi:hypothetical protein ACX80O_11430 [Arthrobacter sp. Hz1]
MERAACSNGVTGTVLDPELTYEADRIVIETYVEPIPGRETVTCQGNNVVAVTVNLTEPVGNRDLVDGLCLDVNAVPATYCGEDDGVRWAVREPSASAIWRLPKGEEVSPSSTSFRVDVTRIGCSGGVTGPVLEPKITYEEDRIVIKTDVGALPEAGYNCPSNDMVQLTVELAEPVGARRLIDGGCLAGEAVTTTLFQNDGVRAPWPPPAGS